MRNLTLVYVTPAVLFLATGAMAAALTKTGEVKSVDTAKHEIVLSNGETFRLNNSVNAASIKAGTKVSISYESKDGKMIASRVTAVR